MHSGIHRHVDRHQARDYLADVAMNTGDPWQRAHQPMFLAGGLDVLEDGVLTHGHGVDPDHRFRTTTHVMARPLRERTLLAQLAGQDDAL